MTTWKEDDRYRKGDWSRADFVNTATELLAKLGIDTDEDSAEPFMLRDRLVRYYTSEGALDRPGRGGDQFRFAHYGYKHLVQLLLTRQLVNDGWPLAKVAGFIKSHSLQELEAMLPDEAMPASPGARPPVNRTPAERAIMSVRDEISDLPMSSFNMEMPPSELFSASASRSLESFEESEMRQRMHVGKVWRSLGHGAAGPAWRKTSMIDLAPGCTVIVDIAELQRMPPGQSALMGQALADALDRLRMQGRERK